MRLNINLPGPFSVSTRVTPNLKPLGRAIAKERQRERTRSSRGCCQHSSPRPVARPQDRTLTDSGTSGGTVALWLLGLTLVILAILGFGGFRV